MTNAKELPTTPITIRVLSQPGCRPCQVIKYALDAEKAELSALKVEVVEHDVTVERELIVKYGIQSTPVLIFERNGLEMVRLSGMVNIREVYDAIEHAKLKK